VATTTPTAPLREFLGWVARCSRTYAEAIDAWGSHCPRYTIWEDATAAGLVEVEQTPGAPFGTASVRLTPPGKALLPD
jgi:hypothetical protein